MTSCQQLIRGALPLLALSLSLGACPSDEPQTSADLDHSDGSPGLDVDLWAAELTEDEPSEDAIGYDAVADADADADQVEEEPIPDAGEVEEEPLVDVEDCANGVDDDGNELTDCEDPACQTDAACLCGDGEIDEPAEECDDGEDNSDELPNSCRTDCLLPWCGDGVTDDEDDEVCDDGVDNSDRIPDACRLDCINAWCGDGTVDTIEECDDGDSNGEGNRCSGLCVLDVEMACAEVPDVLDLNEVGRHVDGLIRYQGTLAGTSADHVPTALCVDDEVETGEDILFVFRPDEDGSYRATTAFPMTAADTVLYRKAECDREGGRECNDDDGLELGSTIFLRNLVAGRPYFIVVDSIAGTAGPFGFAIGPIGGVVGEDEDCSGEGALCDLGLTCTDLGESSECRAQVPPILDDIEYQWLDSDVVLHRFVGSDRNRDVIGPDFRSILLSDASSLGPFDFSFTDIQWGGDDFEGTLTVSGFSTLNAFSLTASVHDELGQFSGILTRDYPLYSEPVEVGEGEECDISQRESVCAAPFVCERREEGNDTCGEARAPVLTGFSAERVAVDRVRFHFEGSDANGDANAWDATLLDGSEVELSTGTFALPPTSIGVIDFRLTSDLFGTLLEPDSGVVTIRANVVDQTMLASDELETELPLPDVASSGEPCDPDGALVVCEPPLICYSDGFGRSSCGTIAGPGEDCDGVNTFCTVGYTCLDDETGEGHCEVDPLFPCGFGPSVSDVMVEGVETEDGILFAFDTSLAEDTSVPSTPGCAFAGQAAGGEAIATLTAEEWVWVTVTTALDGATVDTVLYARVGACLDPEAEVACNDDTAGTYQSAIDFFLEAGETAFVFIDAWDVGGEGEALFTIAPVLGVDLPCDIFEVENLCEPGLYCEPESETCELVPGDYCGGVAKIDVAEEGVAVDNGILVTFDTTGLENTSAPATPGCASRAAGGEIVAFYTSEVSERLTVTTDLEGVDLDTVLYARVNWCLDPEAEVACNDDFGGLQSTIELDLAAGETAFVFLDSWSAGGAGQALFSMVPQ